MPLTWGEVALLNACANEQAHVPPEGWEVYEQIKHKQQAQGKNKFGAVPVKTPERTFASTAEYTRYGELRTLELQGYITDLECQPVFVLQAGVRYIADFRYSEDGQVIVEDVKGGKATMTGHFRDKWKQVKDQHPEIKFVLIGAEGKSKRRGRKK